MLRSPRALSRFAQGRESWEPHHPPRLCRSSRSGRAHCGVLGAGISPASLPGKYSGYSSSFAHTYYAAGATWQVPHNRGPDETVLTKHEKATEPLQAAAFLRRSAMSSRAGSRLAVGCFFGVLVCAPLLVPQSAAGVTSPCTRHLNDGITGAALSPPIALAPASSSAQRIVNFGTSRATKVVRELVFTADKPLPDSLKPEQLNLDAVVSRAGDTLESTDLPDPAFSEPRISQDRQSITFDICLNPGPIPPGKYVGAVALSGPPGLGAASVSLTVNAKVDRPFYVGSAVSLIAALLLLVLKDAAAYRAKQSNPPNWGRSFLHPIADPVWWVTTIVALGAAFGALYVSYAGNPAWGSGGFSDIAALIGAAFAAIGGHTIISTLTPS